MKSGMLPLQLELLAPVVVVLVRVAAGSVLESPLQSKTPTVSRGRACRRVARHELKPDIFFARHLRLVNLTSVLGHVRPRFIHQVTQANKTSLLLPTGTTACPSDIANSMTALLSLDEVGAVENLRQRVPVSIILAFPGLVLMPFKLNGFLQIISIFKPLGNKFYLNLASALLGGFVPIDRSDDSNYLGPAEMGNGLKLFDAFLTHAAAVLGSKLIFCL
mmetsp:Transcript_6166/g.17222  ORF Transcript_6166/g.17222 Transcript_6166/m.17222 type:complete len:219 (+) Transcript_6166:2390-3046(+)